MKKTIWLLLIIAAFLLFSVVAVSPVNALGETPDLPLAEAGPYTVGVRDMTFVDEDRDGQRVAITIWYPALEQADDAAPDLRAAPYPVIVYSHGMYFDWRKRRIAHRQLAEHLASYGLVVVGVEHNDDDMALVFVDRPLDILFVLDQLEGITEGELASLMDLEQLGVMGMSGGTPTALQMGGARIDRANHDAWCAAHAGAYLCPLDTSIPARGREAMASFGVTDENGLDYIPAGVQVRAVAAMAPGFAPLFGERGLATVTVPTLLMANTGDEALDYEAEAVYLYNHLGADERYLITFLGGSHRYLLQNVPRRDHLMTTFFGYYLQGREDYAQYLTEDSVNSIEGLAWGPYGVAVLPDIVTYYITAGTANVRACPRTDCARVTTLGLGEAIDVLGTVEGENTLGSNQWREVRYLGQVVYVHSTLTSLSAPPPVVSVNVPGDVDWVDSGIRVSAGDTFTITASGAVNPCVNRSDLAVCYPRSPVGMTEVGIVRQADPERAGSYPLPSGTMGALIARIGQGQPFEVGAGGSFIAASDGVLQFRINDEPLNNNQGAFSVQVFIQP